MHITETIVRTEDGGRIFTRYCHAATGRTPRTMVVVHGACEHGERYVAFARWLTDRGWNVAIPDLRGHGRSGGVRTHVFDFSEYVADLETVRRHFEMDPERTAVFGHSMGGLIAILHAQNHPRRFAAAVLSSPLLGVSVRIPMRTVLLGRVAALLFPRTRFRTRVKPEESTRNERLQQVRLHDPLAVRSVTAGWYFAMRRAIRQGWSGARMVELPLLIVQAGQDRVVDPQAPSRWLQSISSSDCLFHMRGHDYHELLNEPQWEETAAFIEEWAGRRVETAGDAAAICPIRA